MTELGDVLHSIFQEDKTDDDISVVAKAGMLKDAYLAFMADPIEFQPGELVQWKEGLQSSAEEGPFVVIDVNKELKTVRNDKLRLLDHKSFGDEYRVADIMLGYMDGSGDMMLCIINSRRLEKYTGKCPEDL